MRQTGPTTSYAKMITGTLTVPAGSRSGPAMAPPSGAVDKPGRSDPLRSRLPMIQRTSLESRGKCPGTLLSRQYGADTETLQEAE